ncbi:MAG: TRAP transporter small permease subunit [Pseudomonadota bacterium]
MSLTHVLKSIDHLSRLLGHAAAQLYLVAAAVTVSEVFARYVLAQPTSWAFEMALTLCGVAWVISSGYVTLRERHIAITLIEAVASPKMLHRLAILNHLIGIAAMIILAYAAWGQAASALALPERSGTGFNSTAPTILKTMLFAGAVLYALQLTANLVRLVTTGASGPPTPAKDEVK